MIEDDVRLSRFICRVAESLGLSCQTTGRGRDITDVFNQFHPDAVLLGPVSNQTEVEKLTEVEVLLYSLANQHFDTAIILSGGNSNYTYKLENLGKSKGLNMAGVLPDIFDADTLRHKLVSLFQQLTNEPAHQFDAGPDIPAPVATRDLTRHG